MISTGDISQLAVLLSMLNVPTGGGGGGSVTQREVQISAFNFAETTGADDVFVANLNPPVTSLTDGLIVTMNSGLLQNTSSSPTLQVNSLPAKTITLWGGLPLLPNDISSSTVYLLLYDLDDDTFQLINPSVSTANSSLVQSNAYNAAIDTGAPNAYVVTIFPDPQGDLGEGFPIYFRASFDNTGASTIEVNRVEYPLTLQGGLDLPAGSIVQNGVYLCLFSTGSSSFVLINPSSSYPSINYIESVISPASGVSVANQAPKTITSISVPAGKWVISGSVGTKTGSNTTNTAIVGAISTTNNVFEGDVNGPDQNYPNSTINGLACGQNAWQAISVGSGYFEVESTTTFYLVVQANFTGSSCVGYGKIWAMQVGN